MDKSEHTKQFLEELSKQLSNPADALEEPSIIEKRMVKLLLIHLRRADGFFLKEENHLRVDAPWVEILTKFAKESPHIVEKALSSYLSEHINEIFKVVVDGTSDGCCTSLSELVANIICRAFKFDEPDFVDVTYNGDDSIVCVSHFRHVCGDGLKALRGETLFESEIRATYVL